MSETEYLKERIKTGREKLNDLLKSGEIDSLALDEITEMSRELDKLIVEFIRIQK